MELFINHLGSKDLIYFLKNTLGIEDVEVVTFNDITEMIFLNFLFKDVPLRIVRHENANRFGFKGSLLKIEVNSTVRSWTEKDNDSINEIANSILKVTGGIKVFPGYNQNQLAVDLEGYEPQYDEMDWVYKSIKLMSISVDKVQEGMERIFQIRRRK